MIHSIPLSQIKAGYYLLSYITYYKLYIHYNYKLNINIITMEKVSLKYEAYTDGSCDNLSPYGEGGSAYIILKDGIIIKESKKGFVGTTNNRMEMLAIISAVKSVPKGATLTVYTDSQYCITSFTNCKKPKKNLDLINLYHHCAASLHEICFVWVKGHSGNEYNEHVDSLAYSAYEEIINKYNLPKTRVGKGR